MSSITVVSLSFILFFYFLRRQDVYLLYLSGKYYTKDKLIKDKSYEQAL